MKEFQPHPTLSTKEKLIKVGGYALGIALLVPGTITVGILFAGELLQVVFEKDPTRRLMESDPELRSILGKDPPGISRTNSKN